jgi:structural maintenance of chromosome 1
LVFEAPDGTEVLFTRAINPSGDTYASVYKLDGRTCTAETYNNKLESFGILVRARNFLVFQGDIESVAQMSPKDLTAMFETISGSAALRKEYDEAEARMKDAESAMSLVFSRRKAIAAEKRQKKDQKVEAEKHMKLIEELEGSKVRHALWQVYHLEEDTVEAKDRRKALSNEVKAAEEAAKEAHAELETHRRQQAGVAKERLLLEKQMAKKRSEADKKNPGLIKVREKISHTQRRMKAAEKEGEVARHKATEHTAKLASLRHQLSALEDAQRQVDSELQGSRNKRKSLSPDLLEEYNKTKRELGAKTAKQEAEREALQAAADADAEALKMLEDSVATVNERIKELETAAVEDQGRLARATEAIEKGTAERQTKAKEQQTLQADRRRIEARRAALERRIEDAEGKLRDAKADSKQSAREEARRQLVEHLRSTFPRKVYGLVTDLADPTHERYKLAMSVVLGKDFDSVIVDTPETAMQCIQVVKERRMPPMTFLPAETIRVKEIDQGLRSIGGSCRVAFDCLQIKDERCTRAFQSICGSTLLCDTVPEARQLAFGGEVRQKVIALDGTAFLKTGIITGGITSAMEQRASKWDAGEMGKLKEERARLTGELVSLPTLRELTEKLQAVEAAISRLDNTLHYATADQKATKQKVQESADQVAALKRERETKAPGAAKLEAQIQEKQRKVEAIQRTIDDIAEQMFAGFAKKIGVSSIREYEGQHLKEAERLAERRVAVANQVARVRNQLEYESKADPEAEAAKLEGELSTLTETLENLRREDAEFEAAAAGVKAELEELGGKLAAIKSQLDEVETESKDLKKKARAAADQVAAAKRSISSVDSRLEQLRGARSDVLEVASMEGLVLPTLAGRRAAKAAAKAAVGSDDSDEDDDAMDVDAPESAAGPSTATPKAISYKNVHFDYSSLTDDDRRREIKTRERHGMDLKAQIEDTSNQIARMAPNLKAVEQYDEVKAREKKQIDEVDASRRECKTAAEGFNTIRQRRFDLFNAALSHITANIDPIYKELTRSALHPSGGQAYLAPENPEDPFSAGIKFSAMPPTKRFRDMEQLSGGEKTVAALALLFAVHSFHPSPFFVLDEIDAALDASNVAKVATYMRAKTRPGVAGSFQGIVISLKDVFYEKADALVGVCRSPAHGSSESFTFDLTKYGPPVMVGGVGAGGVSGPGVAATAAVQ